MTQPIGLTVLLAEQHLIAIDKPAGTLSVPGRGADKADCAAQRVQDAWPDALIVHRLDMGTSGILVFGRGPDAQRQLSQAFAQRQVVKRYLAVVDGSPAEEHGVIDLPLICDWPQRPRQKVDYMVGKASVTEWSVLSRHAGPPARAWLALNPLTGRSHQLRVHLQAISHPIVGDDLYAPPEVRSGSSRLMLHAESLTLPHPADGRLVHLHCPCPFELYEPCANPSN